MNYLEILLLAVIQGAAELLPVSSSAHVILVAKLLKIDPTTPQFTFLLVMLHTGTMFAVLVFFWQRWRALLRPSVGEARSGVGWNWHFVWMVAVATAITGAFGYALKVLIEKVIMERLLHYPRGEFELMFGSLPLIGASLCTVGLIIIAAGFLETGGPPRQLTLASSLGIGLIQGLCLPFRGFSRSGATISVGLFCGLSRRLAEDFSFALAVAITPAVVVDRLKKLVDSGKVTSLSELLPMVQPGLVGMVFSFLAGLVALKILSVVLESGRCGYFGFYCLCTAGVMFTAAYLGL